MPSRFKALQEYVTEVPNLNAATLDASMGIKTKKKYHKHKKNVVNKITGDVSPFTLHSGLSKVLGGLGADDVLDKMRENLDLPPEFNELLNGGDLSPEKLAELESLLNAKFDEALGPINQIIEASDAVTPDFVLQFEETAQDYLEDVVGEQMMDTAGEIEIPEFIVDFCEI